MAGRIGKGGTMANTIVGILLVAVILVLVNVISAGTFTRLDLTEGKEFTISGATKDVLRDLNDLVTITVYMSERLPTQLSTLRRQISDILDEYRSFGRGRVQIDFVDPSGDPQLEQKMRSLGIPQIVAQTLERDQFQSVNIYLGMLVSFLDRQEVIPVVQDTYTLEYDLTAAIIKVGREKDYVVGVLSGPTEHDLNKHLGGLKEHLQKRFRVRSVDLRNGAAEVPAEVNLLIVAGPSRVPDRVEYQIDQYLMRGGRILFLVDAIRLPEEGGLQAIPVNSGIEDLLAHYGVRVQKALALDRLNATASFSSGYVRYTLPYPYWVKSVPDLLNAQHPITNRLESLVLPWVAPLEVDLTIGEGDPIEKIREIQKAEKEARREMADKLGVQLPEEQSGGDEDSAAVSPETSTEQPEATLIASVLARTSPQAWTASGHYDLNPQQRFNPAGQKTSSIITAVTLSGRFESFYTDREVPALASADKAEKGGEETIEAVAEETPITESPETQVLVVGNAQFATDSFLAQFPANSVFLQNAIDWMTLGDRLISIRSRGATDRPLKQISEATRSTLKLLCILGTPALVIIFGLVRFGIRRKTSAAQEAVVRVG